MGVVKPCPRVLTIEHEQPPATTVPTEVDDLGLLVTADVILLPTEAGGRRGPIFSGYRPMTLFASEGREPQYVGLCVLQWTGADTVGPGESAEATIHYAPPVRPYLEELALKPGVSFDLWEGHIIGHALITDVREEPWSNSARSSRT